MKDKDGNEIGVDTFNSAGVLVKSTRKTTTPPISIKSAAPKLGGTRMMRSAPMDEVLSTESELTGDTLTVTADSLMTRGGELTGDTLMTSTDIIPDGDELAVDAVLPMMMTTMVTTEYDPETGCKLSETVETTDGLTASKTAYSFNNLGLLLNVSSSFTDEEGKTSDFSLNSYMT